MTFLPWPTPTPERPFMTQLPTTDKRVGLEWGEQAFPLLLLPGYTLFPETLPV